MASTTTATGTPRHGGGWDDALPKESYNYRLRFIFRTLFPVFGVPIIISQMVWGYILLPSLPSLLVNRAIPPQLHVSISFLLTHPTLCASIFTLLCIPLYISLWVLISDIHTSLRARHLNAVVIPCIRGKWPGNVDILYEFLKRGESFYHGDYLRELYDEYGVTTLNLRFFWMDQVRIFSFDVHVEC